MTATGLKLEVLGGVQLTVDGVRSICRRTMNYKGMMFSDVPNLASAFGYTNASWTLKVGPDGAYVCRLLNHMERHRHAASARRAGAIRPCPRSSPRWISRRATSSGE